MSIQTSRGICFNCFSNCGIVYETENGRLVNMKGDRDNPLSQGFICRKSRAVDQTINHPERLRRPLKRVGAKGEGKWAEIGWDEALDEAAYHLDQARREYGPESVVVGSGTNSILVGLNWFIGKFIHTFGTPNHLRESHICRMPAILGGFYTFGYSPLDPDFENSRCVVVWGTNPDMSRPPWAREIRQAIKKGAKLLVIDPRRIGLAKKADLWLQVRPGTDLALALGLARAMIEEGLYDQEFVRDWAFGFEEFRAHVQDYDPARVEEITSVPQEAVRQAARMLGENRPVSLTLGDAGLVQHTNSLQTLRAAAMVLALTGSLDVPGGNLHLYSALGRRSAKAGEVDLPFGMLSPEQICKRLGYDRFRVLADTHTHMAHPSLVWRAMLEDDPYPIRAMLAIGGNVVISGENSREIRQALARLPYFVISGLHMSPTAQMADLVLPAAHWVERPELLEIGSWVFAHVNPLEPVPDCRDDRESMSGLAQRLGLDEFWSSIEESLDFRLGATGMTWQEFKKVGSYERKVEFEKYKERGFRTPSGKVEFYSQHLEELGYDPIPVYREPSESRIARPDLAEEYPLTLITGIRHIDHFMSDSQHVELLSRVDPFLEIHPETAAELGIGDGDWVRVESPRGSVRQKAIIFEGIAPDVVASPYGFWYGVEEGWREVNINTLTDGESLSPEVGSSSLKVVACRVSKL